MRRIRGWGSFKDIRINTFVPKKTVRAIFIFIYTNKLTKDRTKSSPENRTLVEREN